ncbi:MAG: CusA/CzcA family heavy metal efflux RND transporter [Bacteroidetes bacterium B1(2017)]|nr:MAG: CusA/CzcA family heavy metal efflux RND transporter [Bacteroidetes bacterium B1(2017)]
MLNKIIGFSVHNKLIIALFTLFLLVYGAFQLTKLPIDAVPDITNNQVQVITISPSLGAPDVERLITFPLEQALSNIPGKIEIRSFSRFGLSLVTIVFDDKTDVYWARQQVSERLQGVKDQIPAGVGAPELGPVTTGLGEIYQYVVRPKPGFENKYNAQELRTIQDWMVRRQLLGVKGVADVSSFGGYLKQYEVELNPNRLQAQGLSIQDVFSALNNNNQNEGGAYIEKGPQVLFIRSEGLIKSSADIEQVVVKVLPNGSPVFVKDIGEVHIGHATRYGAMVYNDKQEVAGAVVMMLKGANSNEVIKAVKERIAKIQETLPEGVLIDAFLDRTKMVNNAIGTVETNLMEGALIVIFILVLFLGNIRAGLLVASVIPLSMLFAVIMMNAFGVSGNLMSLGALDFGLIVDGAVIIVEAVMHAITHSRRFSKIVDLSQKKMDTEVKHAAGKMMNSAVFGQLVILIVYLPIFSLEGIEGKMFKPMAQTVAFALLGAFILSLTYIPMMSAILLKNISHTPNFADRWMVKIESFYRYYLVKILARPKAVITTVIVLFISSLIVMTQLGGEFIPSLEEGDFAVETRVLTGSNLNVSIDVAKKAAHILKSTYPEVEEVVCKIGSGEIPTDPMPMEAQDLMVILKDKKEWTSAKTFPELAEKMSKSLEAIPGATFGFQYPVQMRFNELMTGARQDVVCKIFGEDLDTLALYAEKMGKIAQTIEGARDVYIEPVNGMPQIVIELNRALLAQYKLNVSDVNQMIHAAFAGKTTGMVYEGERRFKLVVRLAKEQRTQLDDIRNLLIPVPSGMQVPLYQLASINIIDGPNQIQREDAKRRIVMGFNVRGRDVQSIVKDLQAKMKADVKLPPGYYVTYGGAFENLEAAKSRLAIAVPVSLLLILLLLYFAFNSMKQGLLIYSAIPLSAIGGIFALASRGLPFSISAGVGFIALFGVAVLNGIVLIAEFNRQRTEGLTDLKEIVLAGTKLRLRPVLMTACVASLGFMPMALSNGAGAEVQRPLATVVIGGLLLATFLTLFVLPVLYMLFERKPKVKYPKAAVFIPLLFVLHASAQTPIQLSASIDTAFAHNKGLSAQEYKTKAAQKLKGSAWNLPNTMAQYEKGQINSNYSDDRFVVSQSLAFPTVYLNQKKVLKAEYELAQQELGAQKLDLGAEVSRQYYSYLFLDEKERILLSYDTAIVEQLKFSRLRMRAGESNIIENASAEQQRAESMKLLQQTSLEKQACLIRFQLLLGTDNLFLPKDSIIRIPLQLKDTVNLGSSPYLMRLQKQKDISLGKLKTERSKYFPEFQFGYQNMSITGTGADNIFYPRSQRFQAIQLGVGVPLFFGSTQSKSKALSYELKARELEYQYTKSMMSEQVQNLQRQLLALDKLCVYYETVALPQAKKAREAAWSQFKQGSLNFMEWNILNTQTLQTNTNYLETVQQFNQLMIHYKTFQP